MAIIIITTKHIEMRSKRIKRRVWGNRIEDRQRGKEEESKEGKYKTKKEKDAEKKLDGKQRKLEEKDRRQQERK